MSKCSYRFEQQASCIILVGVQRCMLLSIPNISRVLLLLVTNPTLFLLVSLFREDKEPRSIFLVSRHSDSINSGRNIRPLLQNNRAPICPQCETTIIPTGNKQKFLHPSARVGHTKQPSSHGYQNNYKKGQATTLSDIPASKPLMQIVASKPVRITFFSKPWQASLSMRTWTTLSV